MRNKKLLFVLIPVLVVVLGLIAGIVYITLNSSSEKIFANLISKVFEVVESSEEKYSTMKGTLNLTASVESDSEEMEAVNTMLEGASIGLDMQVDTSNMIVNEKLNVTVNNESLVNAFLLLQDQKGYVYLPDWLDKYLQIPEDELEYSDLTEYYENTATLDKNALMEAIKEELIATISNQELEQEKTTLLLDGQETKVTASTLSLKDAQMTAFYNELFVNLNKNEKFLVALGAYKDDVQTAINEMLLDMEDAEDVGLEITIYTKGLLNEFVGVSGKAIDYYFEEVTGFNVLKHNDGKYEFVAYNEYEGEREEVLKLIIEDRKESKNKGTAAITMSVEKEQFVITYNYEKQGNQTSFVASTEIEGVGLSVSGNATEDGKNIKGNIMVSVQEETFGKVNVNCAYDFTYDVQVQKVDVQNAVLIDELSEEDQTTLMTNFQNSALYQLVEQVDLQGGILEDYTGEDYNDEPKVTYGGFTTRYTVPEEFYRFDSYSDGDVKAYMDDNFSTVTVSVDYDSVETYMKALDDEYVLTSTFYENQKISDTKALTVNGKEYKLRTITYNDETSSYVDLYFAYELDDEYCYVVEVETEVGKMSMETIKKFLDVTVE